MREQLIIKKDNQFVEGLFYGNYFYGICAVALSIEATLQQHSPVNSLLYFGLIFLTTVLYYIYPYVKKYPTINNNPRTNWYSRNYKLIKSNQLFITIILLLALISFVVDYWYCLINISSSECLLILIFPVTGVLYYGSNLLFGNYNLRRIGWLKPFIIGFTWAGLVTVYPVLFYDIINNLNYDLNWVAALLFFKNFMFIAILCIMFDIKDYKADYLCRLKTFVVKIGLRKTIFQILLPLVILGLFSFIYYAIDHGFNEIKLLLNIIPFVLLAVVAYSLKKRRSLIYYLSIVDGLMLVKAVCGIIAITFFY